MIYEYGQPWRNDIDRENEEIGRETCPTATLSTTNPTWTDMGAIPGQSINLGVKSTIERLAKIIKTAAQFYHVRE
jgi:hypothetical protein